LSNIQLIVGLGNPGPKYESTRHNAGFWFVDEWSRQQGFTFRTEAKFHGETAQCNVSGKDRRVFKPSTYMNRSGQAVAALAGFYRIPLPEILVVHDEIDLPVGTVKLKRGGGHGGHNGLRDLISHLGGKDFYRLRIGVEHPGHRDDVTDYVLQRPSKQDRALIDDAIDDGLAVLPDVLDGEIESAMQKLHSRE